MEKFLNFLCPVITKTLCQELHLDLSNLLPQQTVRVCYICFDSWKQGFLDFALVSYLVTMQLLA